MEYTEHDKLSKVSKDSQAIGEFLDCSGYVLGAWSEDGLRPVSATITEILAEYFDIDLAGLEAEKQDMLEQIRNSNA